MRRVDCALPAKYRQFTFRIPGTCLTVLDPYGDDVLPTVLRERLLGANHADCVLAICSYTGAISLGWFEGTSKNNLTLCADPLNDLVLPKSLRGKVVKNLAGVKRPYRITLPDFALGRFIDRAYGYYDLGQYLQVELSPMYTSGRILVSKEEEVRIISKYEEPPKGTK